MDPETRTEEPFTFKVEKITGARSVDTATGVFRRRLIFADGAVGELVSCILVAGGNEEDLGVFLGDIFELAVKRLEDSKENILESLQLALESGQEYGAGKSLNVGFVHCFFYENACFVCRFGDKVSLLAIDSDKAGPIDVRLGSGPVVDGQIFLVATRKFLNIFDTKTLTETKRLDLEEVIDGLATAISDVEDQSEIGAVFVAASASGKKEEGVTELAASNVDVEVDGQETQAAFAKSDERELVEVPQKLPGRRVGIVNPLPAFFGTVFGEIRKLRRGDLRAIFRLRRNIVALCLAVVLILTGSVFYNLYGQKQKAKNRQVLEHLVTATSKYNEAQVLVEINKARARTLLVDADNEAKAALTVDPKNIEANRLKDDISAKLKETELATSVKFEALGEFADELSGIAFSGRNLIAAHGNKFSVINPTDTKTNETDIGNTLGAVAVYSNNAFFANSDNIKKVDLASEKIKEIATEGGLDIDVFFGNVYILNKNQIRKFVPIENGYSGSDYLGDKIDLADSSRMTIDSSVWVTKGGRVLKFTRGNAEDFEISGLVNANFTLGAIYTNPDIDNLYVIDSANSVLLVISKKGVYEKVYQSAEFAKVRDLVVDETAGKMYLAVGSKVLTASL